jgi:hypothetical protein
VRISDFRNEPGRASATVSWEESERPPVRISFEVDAAGREDLVADPNGFLVGAYFPAVRHGERRIALEGPISPRLRDGLVAVNALFRSWYEGARPDPTIEPTAGFRAPYPRCPSRAAAFVSGGVDSSFSLRLNREEVPFDHPASFRDLIWLAGRGFPGEEESPPAVDHRNRLAAVLSELAGEAGADLIPVRTNLRQIEPDMMFLGYEFQAAYVASAALMLANRFDVVSFSSGWDLAHLIPWGTHPLVDPNLGTEALSIRHDGIAFGRAEKLRRLARWETAIRNLVVCNDVPPGPLLNCGRCYKCVETMTLLESEGLFSLAGQFPADRVTPEMVDAVTLAPNLRSSFREYAEFWRAMIPGLEARGRTDLVRAVGRKLESARRLEIRLAERDWKGRLKRLDRALTGGLGYRMARSRRGSMR